MSVKVMGLIWDMQLPQNEKYLLLAYADHADHDGGNIYPSIALIAQKTGYSVRQVKRITKNLVEQGLLIYDGKGPQGTNRFRIPMSKTAGDTMSPQAAAPARGDKMSPPPENPGVPSVPLGVTSEPQGGDILSRGGDIAMSPEPSIKPSFKPSREPSGVRVGDARAEIPPDFQDLTPVQVRKIPEIAVFIELTGRYPGRPQMPIIWRAVRDNGFTISQLEPYWTEWVTRGYRPENLAWLTEWAVQGSIPPANGRGPGPQKQSAFAAVLEQAMQEARANGD